MRLLSALLLLAGLQGATEIQAATSTAPRTLLLDACVVANSVFAVGEHGLLVRSNDSGQSWTTIRMPVNGTFTGISFSDTHYGWIVGHGGIILATSDGGLSWSEQSLGASNETSLLDLINLDAHHIIVVGSFGSFFSTVDAGHNWNARKVLNEDLHLNGICRGRTGDFFVAGERGTLLHFANFRAEPTPLTTEYQGSFNGTLVLKDGTVLAYGLRGHAYRSVDNGSSWTAVTDLPPILLSTAIQLKSGTVVIAGQARTILVSQDNAQTFSRWTTPVTTALAKIVEAPDGSLLCFGEGGVVRIGAPPAPDKPATP